ncbi:hypothetical protein [Sporosarcina koreensis]|uniref:hypothetical protein n=1 Tax=Sporosarcina koreensis TaxID=334735 RepID=UPI0007530CF3|nr:hypothetical protein [Sporosarcina koreensis]
MVSIKYEPIHVLFDSFTVKWTWKESELAKFRKMWNDGDHIQDIAKAFNTNKRSIALVVMEQAELGEIKPRAGGLFGN